MDSTQQKLIKHTTATGTKTERINEPETHK